MSDTRIVTRERIREMIDNREVQSPGQADIRQRNATDLLRAHDEFIARSNYLTTRVFNSPLKDQFRKPQS